MLSTRVQAKEKLQEALAKTPITILASAAGTGKSRLIDSVFEHNGDLDRQSCVMIRFDERVKDFDTFTRSFTAALDLQMPDDVNPYDFILAAIHRLPKGLVIIIDDLHILKGQEAAFNLIKKLVEESGTFNLNFGRRWLLGTRDVADLPYVFWHAKGACTTLFNQNTFPEFPVNERPNKRTLRESALRFAALRYRNFPSYSIVQKDTHQNKQARLWIQHCDGKTFGTTCICVHENHLHQLQHPKVKRCQLSGATRSILNLLSILPTDLRSSILSCSLAYEMNPDFLIDHIPNIQESISILLALDLAHVDLASGQVKMDFLARKALHKILTHSSEKIIIVATRIACELSFKGADIPRALSILVARSMWSSAEDLLSDFGLDLFERDQVNGIISQTLSSFPEEIKIESPVISGLLGVVTSRVNYSDVSESHFKCALENENFQGPLRRMVHYRYALEIARRGREDAAGHLNDLLAEAYSDENFDVTLQALVHSLSATFLNSENPDTSLDHIHRAMNAASQIDNNFVKARVLNDCASAFFKLGEFERSILHAKESISISIRNNFHDLASRTLSILQDLAYRYEHNLSLAEHYNECMSHHAERAGESRIALLSWLGRYWLFIESGRIHEVQTSHANIDRYTMPDNFMQDQIQSCTVPGAAMTKAWKGQFSDAIDLVESYAVHETDQEDRAFRWSELCIYYAAQFALTNDVEMKRSYVAALHHTRSAIRAVCGPILQEGNIALRIAISLVVIGRLRYAKTLLPFFDSLRSRDRRAPAMTDMLRQMITWNGDLGQGRKYGDAIRGLFANDLGGIALLIEALPPPPALR